MDHQRGWPRTGPARSRGAWTPRPTGVFGIAAEAERQQRFEREAQSVAALNHPGIVTIHSIEHDGDVQFLTMELIEGRTLTELIARGIVHRDLKPANVMVTPDGRVKDLVGGRQLELTKNVSTSGAPQR